MVAAAAADQTDFVAPGLLGHMHYHLRRRDEAIADWRLAVARGSKDPVVLRNLGLAAVNHLGDDSEGQHWYERAIAEAPTDPQLLYEYDQLLKRRLVEPKHRLEVLLRETMSGMVDARDDLTVELLELLNLAGRFDQVRQRLLARRFHPWEGGEGLVLRQWATSALGLARAARRSGRFDEARGFAESALSPPACLGETWHMLQALADVHLELGLVASAAGDAVVQANGGHTRLGLLKTLKAWT